MSTYAQVTDFQSYTELTINTASGQQQTLLDTAERDVDRLIPLVQDLTDLIEGVALSGVTDGFFVLSLDWGITSYTTAPIPAAVAGSDLLGYLNGMQDLSGCQIPSGSWIQPSGTYNDQYYAFGPLPAIPIVVEATGMLGCARLPLLSVDTTMLIGADGETDQGVGVTITQMVGGGLKVDPHQLSFSDSQALTRAVCAQAEYRDQMGPEFFAIPQFKVVSGPEFNTQGRRPRIGPRVLDELAGTDLVQRGARAVVSTRADMAMAYQPIGTLGIPDDWRAF
jgi:hypothetical protein